MEIIDLLAQIPSPDDIMRRYGDRWAVAYFFGWIVLATIILIWIALALARVHHRKRRARRQSWGSKWGLTLLDTEAYDRAEKRDSHVRLASQIALEYPYVDIFKAGTSYRGAMHMLEGIVQSRPTRVFEFKYITGSGKHMVEHHFSAVGIQLNSVKGHLGLRKHGWRDGLSKEDIQTGRSVLDDRYYIWADEWALLANELPDDLAQVLEESNEVFELVVAVDKMVMIANRRLKNEAYDRLMEDAIKLADWLDTKR
jgi:hypothetical protein